MNAPEVKIYESPEKAYTAIAKSIVKQTQISKRNAINIALSGGNSPKGLFQKISNEYADIIPWKRIHLWWGDERCVPPTDEQSNYKMTVDYLLTNIDIPDKNIHRIYGENEPISEALRYSKELNKNLHFRDGIPVFDIIILGLGDDGHTASIFPDQMELFDCKQNCAVASHPISGQKRVSLTGKVLNNANQVSFLVTGKNKAMRVSEIINNNDAAKWLPAYYIAPKHGKLIWFLDADAASLIS